MKVTAESLDVNGTAYKLGENYRVAPQEDLEAGFFFTDVVMKNTSLVFRTAKSKLNIAVPIQDLNYIDDTRELSVNVHPDSLSHTFITQKALSLHVKRRADWTQMFADGFNAYNVLKAEVEAGTDTGERLNSLGGNLISEEDLDGTLSKFHHITVTNANIKDAATSGVTLVKMDRESLTPYFKPLYVTGVLTQHRNVSFRVIFKPA